MIEFDLSEGDSWAIRKEHKRKDASTLRTVSIPLRKDFLNSVDLWGESNDPSYVKMLNIPFKHAKELRAIAAFQANIFMIGKFSFPETYDANIWKKGCSIKWASVVEQHKRQRRLNINAEQFSESFRSLSPPACESDGYITQPRKRRKIMLVHSPTSSPISDTLESEAT